jgi:hypothetical protein
MQCCCSSDLLTRSCETHLRPSKPPGDISIANLTTGLVQQTIQIAASSSRDLILFVMFVMKPTFMHHSNRGQFLLIFIGAQIEETISQRPPIRELALLGPRGISLQEPKDTLTRHLDANKTPVTDMGRDLVFNDVISVQTYYALKVRRLAQTMCRRLRIVKSHTLSITRISQTLAEFHFQLSPSPTGSSPV